MTEQAAAARRRYILYVMALFAVGLVLRLGFVGFSRGPRPDTDAYVTIADNLAAGGGYSIASGEPTAYRPPLYPLYIALVRAVTGGNAPAIWIQAVMQAFVVFLVAWLARGIIGDLFALVAAALVAMDPYQIALTNEFMTECFYSVVVALSVAAFVWALRSRSPAKYAFAGLLAGAGGITRPEFLLFIPGALVVLVLRGQRRRRLICAAAFVLVAALPPLGWGARNRHALGSWVFTTTHGGYTHRLAYNPVFYREVVSGAAPLWKAESLEEWQKGLEVEAAGMGEVERDAANYREANAFIREDPGGAAQIAVYEMLRFWAAVPRRARGLTAVVLAIFYILLAGLAIVGVYVAWRKRPTAMLVAYIMAAETLTHAWYWSDVRMRVPFHPLLAVLTAVGLATLFGRKIRITQPLPAAQENALYTAAA